MLWAALFIAVLFLGGAQLVLIGVLGEYVRRIYGEVKRRPLYLREGAAGLPSPAAQSAAPQGCSCPLSGISPGTPSGLFTSTCRAVSSPDGAGRTLFPGRAPISPRRWALCAHARHCAAGAVAVTRRRYAGDGRPSPLHRGTSAPSITPPPWDLPPTAPPRNLRRAGAHRLCTSGCRWPPP